jgi:hypothetical protein
VAPKKLISRILVLEDILCLQECALLISLYDRYSELTRNRDYNCRPLLDYYTLRDVDSKSASWVCGITLRCKEKIKVYLSATSFALRASTNFQERNFKKIKKRFGGKTIREIRFRIG